MSMEFLESVNDNQAGIQIALTTAQTPHPLDESRLLAISRIILTDAGYQTASISLVVVDDPTIHDLNRRYLDHDYPTDVLSFPLEDRGDYLEGEVVASADTAAREAINQGCPVADELMLYIIHGLLHLVGYRDKSAEEASRMRAAEKHYLNQAGIEPALSHKSRAGERTS